MTDREHLPARRHSLVFDLELNGLRFTASYSCFLDNRVGEIFLQNHKPGSQSDSNARDAAMAAYSSPCNSGVRCRRCSTRCCAILPVGPRRRSAPLSMQLLVGGTANEPESIHTVTAILAPRILIHGPEGIGKTTLASKFPSPIFLQTEDGCPGGLEINSFGPIESFADLRSAISALASEPHRFQTVVLDSIDAAEELIWRDVCRSQGWSSIESPGYGRGYIVVNSWWLDILKGLDYLRRQHGMIPLLLGHSAIETINDPRVASYTSYQLRLHKRARGLVQDNMDAIGFLAPNLHAQSEEVGFGKKRNRADGGSQRWLHFESRPSFVAKNRYGLPAKMPVPKDFSYEALAPYLPPQPSAAIDGKPNPNPTKQRGELDEYAIPRDL